MNEDIPIGCQGPSAEIRRTAVMSSDYERYRVCGILMPGWLARQMSCFEVK